MKKIILPKTCIECFSLRWEKSKITDNYIPLCGNKIVDVNIHEEKPEWCPLKSFKEINDTKTNKGGATWLK